MLLLEHSAILLTIINLPFVIKIFVLSIFEWPPKTGFTVRAFKATAWCHHFIRSFASILMLMYVSLKIVINCMNVN